MRDKEKLKERKNFEDPGLDERIILNWSVLKCVKL
jgi:hypothetical protein